MKLLFCKTQIILHRKMTQNSIQLPRISILFFFFFTIAFLSLCPPTLSLHEPDPDHHPIQLPVHELLSKYGLPRGLLPASVASYTLSADGRFVVVLPKPCYIQFDYLTYFDKTISGKIGYGSISDLKGIQVKKLFLWLDVDSIKVDLPPSDWIYFQVGIVNKKLAVDQFNTVHSCKGNQVSGSCGDSSNRVIELPATMDGGEFLIPV